MRLTAHLLYAMLFVMGCAPLDESEWVDAGEANGPAFAGAPAPEVVRSEPDEPDEATLCKLVFGSSSKEDATALLGETSSRASAHSSSLLYQFTSGFTLSLVFVDDVLSDANVYNRDYPECWAEQERRRMEEAEAALADGGYPIDGGF